MNEMNLSPEAAQQIARTAIEKAQAERALSESERLGQVFESRQNRARLSEASQVLNSLIAEAESGQSSSSSRDSPAGSDTTPVESSAAATGR
jgi:hypothetical protein